MTKPQEREPPKLLAGGVIKFRIALASGLVLTVGAWLAPRAAQTTVAAPQEHAAPLLEEQVQLREAGRTFVGVQDVAVQAKDHSVAVLMPTLPTVASRNDYSEPASTARRVAGFGVLVSDALVLTHSLALDGRSAVELSFGAGVTKQARVVPYEPPSGLVLLQTEHSTKTPVALATQAPAAGRLRSQWAGQKDATSRYPYS